MNFIKEAIKKSHAPSVSVVAELNKVLKGFRPARGYTTIHASDITNPTFCPREVALLDITKKPPKGQYIPTALAVTFEMGKVVENLVRSEWLGGITFGDWKCLVCGKKYQNLYKPESCSSKDCDLKYVEPVFYSNTLGVSGSIDALMKLGPASGKLTTVEIKTVAAEEFAKIEAPLSEHRLRTSLYLQIIETSDHPLKHLIDTNAALILYVSRGHGKKNETHNEILPFKEFEIHRDDSSVGPYVNKALTLKKWRMAYIIPSGVCTSNVDSRMKSCPVAGECTMGAYPSQTVFKKPQ